MYHVPQTFRDALFSMLLFKKKFLEQIRRGEKTQTIRLWTCRRMKSGQRSYIPGIGYISIDSVDPVEIAYLTDYDAILDGFPTAELLQAEIRSLYADQLQKEYIPYRIRFSVYPPLEQQRMKKQKQKQKQEEKTKKNQDSHKTEWVAQNLDKLQKMCR